MLAITMHSMVYTIRGPSREVLATVRHDLFTRREEPDEVDTLKLDQIEVKSYVGGLVKSLERKAA